MKIQAKILIFIIGVCSLMALADAACKPKQCFDCNTCNKSCNKRQLQQCYDNSFLSRLRELLCLLENRYCKKYNNCDEKSFPITIYPAANYDVSLPAYKPSTIRARKNCCYTLTGIYDNTLSGLQNNGACVQLYDGSDCTGASIKVDSTWSADCLKWIDCAANPNKFNDKASSFQLC